VVNTTDLATEATEAPRSYRYDPNFGSTREQYTRASGPLGNEVPAVFVATVEGETLIGTLFGIKPMPWRATPGTQCTILGYWEDGSVHLRWRAIQDKYPVDGRFPGWVVRPQGDERVGSVLRANNPRKSLSGWRLFWRWIGLGALVA
jgi:hypothetical protein